MHAEKNTFKYCIHHSAIISSTLEMKERVSKLYIQSHTSTLLDNAAHNEWQCHALVMGNLTENHIQIQCIHNNLKHNQSINFIFV